MKIKEKREKFERRKRRTRKKIIGVSEKPRLCVFRSNRHIYGQIIDDQKNRVLLAYSDLALKLEKKLTKTEIAREVGLNLAKKAIEKGIKKVVFDRGGYKYGGRIKALAEGAREGGLIF